MNDILRFQLTRSLGRRIAAGNSAAIALDLPTEGDLVLFLDGLSTVEEQKAMLATIKEGRRLEMEQCTYMLAAFLNMESSREARAALAAQWFSTASAIPDPASRPLPSALDEIDQWLCAHADQPSAALWLAQLQALLGQALTTPTDAASAAKALVRRADWLFDRLRLGISLMASLSLPESEARTQEVRTTISRLVVVASVVEDIARGSLKVQDKSALRRVLGTRRITLPWVMLRPLKKPSNLARKPGMADLYVVRQAWWKYVAGEVAHIETVMAHETKRRIFERRERTETYSQEALAASSSEERENQTTSRFELSEALRESSASNWFVNGSVGVSAEYPQVVVTANASAGFDQSSERSQETARTEVSEMLSRAVSRIERNISQLRSTRSEIQVLDRATHVIDNKAGPAENAIYRWVDKINSVELWKYPHRFLVDLQIPEPAAWLRHVMAAKKRQDQALPPEPPAVPNTLDIEGISTDPTRPLYYMVLAQQFEADVPPPPATRRLAIAFGDPTKASANAEELPQEGFEMKDALSVPDGYIATTWQAVVRAQGRSNGNSRHDAAVWVAVGGGSGNIGGQLMGNALSGVVGDITDGVVPITVQGLMEDFFAVHIVVNCEPSAETMMRWRFDVVAALRAARDRARRQWAELKAAQEASGELVIDGRSPLRNRELVRNELKRLSMELIAGQRFVGPGGMRPPATGFPPEMDLTIARDHAARIQFMEQAFEWSNLSYVPYPHYWAENGNWPGLSLLESEDPEFGAFLRSGSTRVIVPARPGFEAQVQLFLDYGLVWGGGPVPGPNSQDYVSVAEEIREMYHGPRDGDLVEQWDVTLPTSLVCIDPAGALPLVNPAIQTP